MKEMPDLICGKAAVGGNYNSTRDMLDNELKDFLLDDVSQNGNTDGFMEIPKSPEDEEELNRLFDRVSIA